MNISRKALVTGAVLVAAASSAMSFATVNAVRHPQMAQAQNLINQAAGEITAAQAAHNYALGGHAANAKNLLAQASAEIDAAAASADGN